MQEPVTHIIGCARTIKTSILVVEYLRRRYNDKYHIKYVFKEPSANNGYWSSDIVVLAPYAEELPGWVEVCRAFVAGAGEIWC